MVFSGVVFLGVIVLGQTLLLYSEQRLGRALLVIGLGAAITASIVWFSLKREANLARISIIRADLAS